MKRILLLTLTILLILVLLYVGAGVFGEETIKASVPVVALTAAAVFLPGGTLHWRGLWLLVGILLGIVGFVISIGLFPDTVIGYLLGAATPVLIAGLLTMWTKTPAYFLAGLFGIAATQGVYSVSFYTDPGGVAFNLPIALRIALAPMVLTYVILLGLLALEPSLAPNSLARGSHAVAPGATPAGDPDSTRPNADESDEPEGADESYESDEPEDGADPPENVAETTTAVEDQVDPATTATEKSGAAE